MGIVDQYFKILKIKPDFHNRLTLLEDIIRQHQLMIPFDTVRKRKDLIINRNLHESYYNIENYLKSVESVGYGGTCFHLTWSLYVLLKELKYEVNLIKMEENHFALAIIEQNIEYFVDVSFWAPLFKLLPLRTNWEISTKNFGLVWVYKEDVEKALLYREGALAKTWDGGYISEELYWDYWKNSMNKESIFLKNIFINKWEDVDTFLFLRNGIFKEFFKGNKVKEIDLNEDYKMLEEILTNKFKVNVDNYIECTHSIKSSY